MKEGDKVIHRDPVSHHPKKGIVTKVSRDVNGNVIVGTKNDDGTNSEDYQVWYNFQK